MYPATACNRMPPAGQCKHPATACVSLCWSQVRPGEGGKAYSDLPIVSELRGLANRARLASKVASRSSDESLKWLSWPDFLKVVQQLRCECAGAVQRRVRLTARLTG